MLSLSLLFLFFFSIFSAFSARLATSTVPQSERFVLEIDPYFFEEGEYGATTRAFTIENFDTSAYPFDLCFYNTTPDAFSFGIGMAIGVSSKSFFVWEANRGKPVRLNATLSFGEDGNLVLADIDGTIAWQTNTANKGVVGVQLLANGNLVLRDSKGNFIWQSFDHPTDTLLVGQSLRIVGATKLVSRLSEKENSDGPYSLVLESKRLAMYYKSPNSPKPYLYYTSDKFSVPKGRLQNVTFGTIQWAGSSYFLYLELGNSRVLTTVNFNSSLSFLRLGMDGNLRIYSFDDSGLFYNKFILSFTLFSRDPDWESECQLPERCGKFGLCEDNQCVACPLPNGLMGWSKDCQPVKPPPCGSKNFHYYKLEGVDHYMCKHTNGNGPMKEEDCEKKCSSDCKCLAYFYNKETSKCWIAYDLQTLTRVGNSTHLVYIKTLK